MDKNEILKRANDYISAEKDEKFKKEVSKKDFKEEKSKNL